MTAADILKQLKPLGSESYARVLKNHGVKEPVFGVKIEELKKFQKRIKTDYQLALDLYDTGVYDAMYLAGLVADDAKMTKRDLRGWLAKATCDALCGFTVAVGGGGEQARPGAGPGVDRFRRGTRRHDRLGDAHQPRFDHRRCRPRPARAEASPAARGGHDPRAAEPRPLRHERLRDRGRQLRPALTALAIEVGEKVGRVTVDMGDTSCKVPSAPEYIRKVQQRGSIGKKRKTAKC